MKGPIVVLAGPTASGKTELALRLAEALDGEVVGADSQQVYRSLAIGTAKPSAEARAKVPHHLVDVADLDAQWTAARYVEAAERALSEISGRGRVPLVVGGTFLWIRSLLYGLAPAPPRCEAVRRRLEACAEREGSAALHTRLAQLDPKTAARLHPNDRVRIIRALEVHEVSGEPLSAHLARHVMRPRYRFRLLALAVEREELRARIRRRVEAMIAAGWGEEAEAAAARFGEARVAKVLGYADVLKWRRGKATREETVERIAARTWHYAKRQLLWLRADPHTEWIPAEADPEAVASDLRRWIARQRGT
ncbi:MAG: tRNA (adenosine(37)-N6)-dimethylallyltransferase MiaA [Deltaproteobacteria bacterium]|nr:MAG: tRNA (adenosine(37)-N6)-dimethylallyltransferase MiaA [Deltaproteobacteria bacterium]